MDNKFQFYLMKTLVSYLKEKYGYSEKECQIYMKGYNDCLKAHADTICLNNLSANKEYYQLIIEDSNNDNSNVM